MNGKSKCKILKEIRRKIAAENDIAYITEECKFQGNCSGTCPKCEAEVRYLEEQLRKRQQNGGKVAVAGIAAALVITASGCIPVQTGGEPMPGHLIPIETTHSKDDVLAGVPELPTDPDEPLMGDPLPDTHTNSTAPSDDEAVGKVP